MPSSPAGPPPPPDAPSTKMRRATLPPPEWDHEPPKSVGALTLLGSAGGSAVPRRSGMRASVAVARAALREARGERGVLERTASLALAYQLWMRGTELSTAIKLALFALSLDETDAQTRDSVVEWLTEVGDPWGAASVLRAGLTRAGRATAAEVWVRMAVLRARAGDASAAAESLREASSLAVDSPTPFEMLGWLACWASTTVRVEVAASALLDAAERRTRTGDDEGALIDRARAFDLCPSNAGAADSFAFMLAARGRSGAADEIQRTHAALQGARGRGLHLRRLREAVSVGDLPRGLGAAFDAGLEGSVEGDDAAMLDALLARIGIHDLLAVRLDLRARRSQGRERAALFTEIAKLHAGSLGNLDRALEAWVEVLAVSPTQREAREALIAGMRTTSETVPLTDAILRAIDGPTEGDRVEVLRQILALAEEVRAASIALHVVELLAELGALQEQELVAAREKYAPKASVESSAFAQSKAAVDAAPPNSALRREALRHRLESLRSHPGQRAALQEALAELCAHPNAERAWLDEIERVTNPTSPEEVERLIATLSTWITANGQNRAERTRVQLQQCAWLLRLDRATEATPKLAALLAENPTNRVIVAMSVVGAAMAQDVAFSAEATAALGALLPGPMRAVVCAVSAERTSDATRSFELAETALRADATSSRSLAVYLARLDQTPAASLVRSLDPDDTRLIPSASLCARVVQWADDVEERVVARAWARRWVMLRPLDPEALAALFRAELLGGDSISAVKCLDDALVRPISTAVLAPVAARALESLGTRHPAAAKALGRRVLSALGATHPELRDRLVDLGIALDDTGLSAAVLERWAASDGSQPERASLWLRVADLHSQAGDRLCEARALVSALKAGAPSIEVLARVDRVAAPSDSDSDIAILEARAEALSAAGIERASEAAEAWRHVGAARWDLGGDELGATRAWVRALELNPEGTTAGVARDLIVFAGPSAALQHFAKVEAQISDRRTAARVYVTMAQIAIEEGHTTVAFDAAQRALHIDPTRTDALTLAERTGSDPVQLSALYDLLASAAKGTFGRKAAHYRGARQLERRGHTTLATRHAIAAFESVPTLGTAFSLMIRLAQRNGDPAEAARAVERATADITNPEERADWLLRAADHVGASEEGLRVRLDMLLRALNLVATVSTVRKVATTLASLVRDHGDDLDASQMRFDRARKASLKKAEGPPGARVAIALSQAALDVFEAADVASEILVQALDFDADVDEYANMIPSAPRLAPAAVEGRHPFIVKVDQINAQPYSNLGIAPLRLAGAVAAALDALDDAIRLLKLAEKKDPDVEEVIAELRAVEGRRTAPVAPAPVQAGPTPVAPAVVEIPAKVVNTASRVASPVPAAPVAVAPSATVKSSWDHGIDAEARGALDEAIVAFESVRISAEASAEQSRGARDHLRNLYTRSNQRDRLATLLRDELARRPGHTTEHVELAQELASLLATRGDVDGAMLVLETELEGSPDSVALLTDLADVARQSGDLNRLSIALERAFPLEPDLTLRADMLGELARAHEERGAKAEAAQRWADLLELEPDSREAIAAVERLATSLNDVALLAGVLARRIAIASSLDEVRVLRLRRAALLEQRLGYLDDAATELSALVEEIGDDASALRYLADIRERQGDIPRASEAWIRASRVAPDAASREELALRAARLLLKSGDVDTARRSLADFPSGSSLPVIEMRIEIERVAGSQRHLADALDEWAVASMDPPERRSEVLVEAARASLSAGDHAAALERAQRAARIAPASVDAQLVARWLEYRSRGSGTPQEATQTIEDLKKIARALTPEQVPLHAFLIAEALDVVHGNSAGLRELSSRHAEIGAPPLIALGLAERLVRRANFDASLPFFDAALGGNLMGVRAQGKVAIEAADAALQLGDPVRAAQYLTIAADDPETAAIARQRLVDLPVAPAQPAKSPSYPSDPPASLADPSTTVVVPDLPPMSMVAPGVQPSSLEILTSDSTLAAARAALARAPGDRYALLTFRNAAIQDKNTQLVNAIEHVLRAFDSTSSPLPAPPLSSQRIQPEFVTALLFHGLSNPVFEAASLVWEGASHLFRRDAGTYGITGVDRISFGSVSPLSRLYTAAARTLGTTQTALFQRRATGANAALVALLSPPAVVLSGDVREETTDLAFVLGSSLVSASASLALVLALPESNLRSLLAALCIAFGSARPDRGTPPAIATLAELLWQSLPVRAQRRVRELCENTEAFAADQAVILARRVAHRAGLFACGDLPTAIRRTLAEIPERPVPTVSSLEDLRQICAVNPDVADLVLFATTAGFADTRWRPTGSTPSGQFAAVS